MSTAPTSSPEPCVSERPARSSPWRGWLEIRRAGGAPTRRLLAEPRLLIGRAPGAELLLDHHTVSRRHAEMSCDPFGRWWIRDLSSTNGTIVNEEAVSERVLQPADTIAIGDFSLTFCPDPEDRGQGPALLVPVDDDKPTAIRTLLDFAPPRLAAAHLRTLLDFGRRLQSIEDPSERLGALCELVIRREFHATLAVALRLDGGEPAPLSSIHRPAEGPPSGTPYLSRRTLQAVRETGEPVLAGNLAAPGASFSVELTLSREEMALWVIACPLRRGGDALDVLYVTLPPECGTAEWLSLFALAAEVYQQGEANWAARRHAEAHAAIERELETARHIQRALLPSRLDFAGLDVAVGFEPCRWVGGDFADVAPMLDGRVLCTVADVCGKGLPAALVTSSLHTMVRAALDAGPSLAALVDRMNRHLCEWLPAHSFVTLVAAAIDPETGELEHVNAGHPPALLVRAGAARALPAALNPPLGIGPFLVEAHRTRLAPGDVVAMYTDGLTELRDGAHEMLGLERLSAGLGALATPGRTAAEIAAGVAKLLEDFRGEQLPLDDRAFILAKRR